MTLLSLQSKVLIYVVIRSLESGKASDFGRTRVDKHNDYSIETQSGTSDVRTRSWQAPATIPTHSSGTQRRNVLM
jgi:hypothetical protein